MIGNIGLIYGPCGLSVGALPEPLSIPCGPRYASHSPFPLVLYVNCSIIFACTIRSLCFSTLVSGASFFLVSFKAVIFSILGTAILRNKEISTELNKTNTRIRMEVEQKVVKYLKTEILRDMDQLYKLTIIN